MTAAELKQVFENIYKREDWIKVLREVFLAKEIHANPPQVELKENRFNARAVELGHFETAEGLVVGIYEVTVDPGLRLEHNKVGLRNLLRNVYTHDVDAAFIVFSQEHTWRFTYVSEITVYNKETGKREKRKTDPKRYTYIFGRHQLCRTAAERFAGIITSTDLFGSGIPIQEIEKAFSVDLLTKDFYRELSNWYFWALQHVEFPEDAEKNQEVRNSTNTIRLITRLIFVWFLKQKGLVPEELFDPEKISPQLNPGYKNDSLYYKAILQNLFFATLNQEMGKRGFRKGKQHYNITNLFRYEKYFKEPEETLELFKGIPFLNGGLFECLDKPHPTEKTPQGAEKIVRIDGFSDRDDNPLSVPDYLFFGGADAVDLSMVYEDRRQKNVKVRGLIDILNSYNFTVEENTPLDIQVALDPELLGKVFENLLASYNPETKTTARKQTGSFYTPREIVHYMVDESLIAYLKQKVNTADDAESEKRKEALLRELLSYSGNGNPFDPIETRLLIEAIDHVKVLDPACGSGAFPMGVLQQLVHVLQKLDPDNTEWKKIQMQRAQAELQETIAHGDADNFSERIKEIAESFESNTEDYGRKLFLIENCIYGVDIQPIAVQIAKLRFFVSLLCEQTIQEEKENLGIKALPNLETKFVAANTLIALDKPVLGTGNLFLSESQTEFEKLKKALNENRHKYFVAKRREQKLKCHKIDKEIREKIAQLLVHEGWKTEIAKQVASYNPYDQNLHTDWFDPEWMLGVTVGFDIVIGNPPYVRVERIPEQDVRLFKKTYSASTGKFDLSFLFIERGINILKGNGVLCFITTYQFLYSGSGLGLREFLSNNTRSNIIMFSSDIQIFENATTYTGILECKKEKKKGFQKISRASYNDSSIYITSDFPIDNENFTSNKVIVADLTIVNKIKNDNNISLGKNLGQAKCGVVSSADDVFFLSKSQIMDYNLEKELIYPIIGSESLSKWRIDEPEYYCIYPYFQKNDRTSLISESELKNKYPNIWTYFKLNEERLRARSQGRVTYENSDKWYQLNRPREKWIYDSLKIIYPGTTSTPKFAFDSKKVVFRNARLYSYLPNKIEWYKYYLCILNSSLSAYLMSLKCPPKNNNYYEMSTGFLEDFPFKIDSKYKKTFQNLYDDIIISLDSSSTSIIERQIDVSVFKLYELTYEEVFIIEPNFWLSEAEYKEFKID